MSLIAIFYSSFSDGEKFIEDDQTDVGYTRRYRSQRNGNHLDRPVNGHASKSVSARKPAVSVGHLTVCFLCFFFNYLSLFVQIYLCWCLEIERVSINFHLFCFGLLYFEIFSPFMLALDGVSICWQWPGAVSWLVGWIAVATYEWPEVFLPSVICCRFLSCSEWPRLKCSLQQ